MTTKHAKPSDIESSSHCPSVYVTFDCAKAAPVNETQNTRTLVNVYAKLAQPKHGDKSNTSH